MLSTAGMVELFPWFGVLSHEELPGVNTVLIILAIALWGYGQYASAKRRKQEHKEHVVELKLIEERIRQETPGALIARMDSMDRDRTEFVRRAADLDFKQKQIEASHTRLERKVGDAHLRSDNAETKAAAVEQRVEARLSQLIAEHQDSRTQLAEIAKDLASLKDSLSGLACAERDRHEGKKPAFCPLHKIACPLNGEKDKDNA